MAGLVVTYDAEFRAAFYEAIAQGQHGEGMLFEMFAQEFVEELGRGSRSSLDEGLDLWRQVGRGRHR